MFSSAHGSKTPFPTSWAGLSVAVRFAVLVRIGLSLTNQATGATVTWDGSSSGLWATKANWSINAVPAFGDNLIFDEDSNVAPNYSITLGTNRQANSVTFGASAGTNAFTFSGNTLSINGAAGIVNNDTQTQTFSSTVTMGANQTWNAASGGLTFGTVNLSNNNTGHSLTVTGSSNTSITGVIANGGTGAGNIIMSGSGTLTLSGTSSNSYTGTTSVQSGTVNLNKSAGFNAVGTGAITVGDGVGATSSANIVLLASNQIADTAAVTLNSDGRLSTGNFTESIGTIAGTGLIDLSTSGYLTVGANNASSTFGGSITGTGTLEKAGTGTLTFSSTINYAGSLLLSGGTLQLNGIGVTVDTLTLTGNSTIDFAGTNATLNVTNLNLNGFTLNITNWTNAADYFYATNWAGATLDTRGTGSETQVIFNAPTYNGSNTSWQSYDHQITPVPEPSTYGVMLLGLMCALVGGYRHWQKSLVAGKA
jgi:autotransporter-associated beta strand protein